jgi:rare lipoprotein A
MPFGTKLRVTNPDNDKSVIVTVNDRGPFIRGRDLDLSYGAARKIGFVAKGVGRVRIEHVGRDMHYVKYIPSSSHNVSGILSIQVGSFTKKSNALRLKDGLRLNYSDVFIDTTSINGRKYHRVRVGKFKNHDAAYSLAKKLAREGYSIHITSR